MKSFSLGMDVEFFLIDRLSGNIVCPEILGLGDRHDPLSVGKGVALHQDCAAVEITTPPVSNPTEAEFSDYISTTRAIVEDWLSTKSLQMGLHLTPGYYSTVRLPTEMINAYKSLNEFGCAPDINAYTMSQQSPSKASKKQRWRTAGGHVHISSKEMPSDLISFIKALDFAFFSLAQPMLESYRDRHSFSRRTMYGKAGSFRDKVYINGSEMVSGVEYRTPGPEWMSRPQLLYQVFRTAWDSWETIAPFMQDKKLSQYIRTNIDEGIPDPTALAVFLDTLPPELRGLGSQSRRRVAPISRRRPLQEALANEPIVDEEFDEEEIE